MSTNYIITPHVAHVAAVQDAKKALAEGEDAKSRYEFREALRDAQYDSLVDRFLDAADSGFTPVIPEVSLEIYHHAFDQAWMGA